MFSFPLKEILCPLAVRLHFPAKSLSPPLGNHESAFLSPVNFPVLGISNNRIIHYMTFCNWLLWVSVTLPRVIHVVLHVLVFYFFLLSSNVPCGAVPHFISSSVDGCLDCFHFGADVNLASLSICVQVFSWTYILNSLGYIPKSRIVGLCNTLNLASLQPVQSFMMIWCKILIF